jgi:hypothetical protein
MAAGMKPREFLEMLPDLVRQQLPPELGSFEVKGPTGSLVKLHYRHPAVHYEVWLRRRLKHVELGLHFEGDPDSNQRSIDLLSQRADDIRASLGPGVEVGAWDRGWTRVHETLPWEPLGDDFLIEVSLKLSGMIRTLEPLLAAATPCG